MTKDEFIESLKDLGIILTEEQIRSFEIYLNYLIEYNSHTNLTTITNENDIYLKHFYDSLTIIQESPINFNNVNTLVDVGTGAGFPGMVLKIVYPNIHITLIDSNNKKITFLKELTQKLNLSNIDILNVRSEEYAINNLDKVDVVVSRAVANLYILSELCLPLVKENGYFIALKGNINEELESSKKQIEKLNGKVDKIATFNLIKEESIRNILYIKKINKTPNGYPRNYAKIKKEYEKSIFK